jgi:hypothetical protein
MVRRRRSVRGSVEYSVKLDGLKLSADAESQIEGAIRAAVLEQLARLDFGGDLVVSPLGRRAAVRGGGGDPTQGIHVRGAEV